LRLTIFLCGTALAAAAVLSGADKGADKPCQVPFELRPKAENLGFARGLPGDTPAGWFLGPEWSMPPHKRVYQAKNVQAELCSGNGSTQCAKIESLRAEPAIPLGFLFQIIDATPYRGMTLTFKAKVRTDVNVGGVAKLLVHVHRNDCSTAFRDDMGDHTISSGAWINYQLHAPIAADARDIEFGMQLIGQGTAWIDDVSMKYRK